jgi:hypothetical protein
MNRAQQGRAQLGHALINAGRPTRLIEALTRPALISPVRCVLSSAHNPRRVDALCF